MCGMAGARVGSRPYDVGGHEFCRRGSIQFPFHVRQKENVVGWQADLLTDRAVAGCYLIFADTGIEKMLKQRCHISDVGVCKEEPLCLLRARRGNSQTDAARHCVNAGKTLPYSSGTNTRCR